MSRETIFEAPGLVLWFHSDTKIIHHELQKYPGAKVLESMLEKGLEVLRGRGACKWLSDDRRGGALPKSHHEWADEVWGPKAVRAGWKYWALVPPTNLLGSSNLKRLVQVYGAQGVTAQTFSDPQAAMNWLVSC